MRCSPTIVLMWRMKTQRAKIYLILREAYNAMDMETDDIIVQSIPNVAMYASKDIGKKKCKLIPVPEKVNQVMKKSLQQT